MDPPALFLDKTAKANTLSQHPQLIYVRETDVPAIHVGQALRFTVPALPDRSFPANIRYVASTLDPTTRRLLVWAAIDNSEGLLKPEMFATVTILTGEGDAAPAVPRDAVIYEGETAHIWTVGNENSLELRQIKTGLTDGRMIQVLEGLRSGEKVITKGSLFIDRAAVAS